VDLLVQAIGVEPATDWLPGTPHMVVALNPHAFDFGVQAIGIKPATDWLPGMPHCATNYSTSTRVHHTMLWCC
jgi:hypothetical protein